MDWLPPQRWRSIGKWFSYRGHKIFYRDEGSGPLLLCIHGFPTCSWDWHRIWPVLTSHFRVVAPDMIGFGFSDKPVNYAYGIRDQADLLEALLRALTISRCHILAHDYGDTVVQELLARDLDIGIDPARRILTIDSVCLLNGGLFPDSHRPRLIQKLLMSPMGSLFARFYSERRFRNTFSAIFGPETQPSALELSAFWSMIEFNQGRQVIHKLIRYMAERKQFSQRWTRALQEAEMPLVLVDGLADPISGAHLVAKFRERVPRAGVIQLDRIGHYPQVEAPDAVIRALLDLTGSGLV